MLRLTVLSWLAFHDSNFRVFKSLIHQHGLSVTFLDLLQRGFYHAWALGVFEILEIEIEL